MTTGTRRFGRKQQPNTTTFWGMRVLEENMALGPWQSGFNSGVFDIQPRVVEKVLAPETDEAKVQAIIDNKAINRAGGLFKLGEHVANSAVVMEAARRIAASDKLDRIAKQQKKKDAADKSDNDARLGFSPGNLSIRLRGTLS